MLINLNDPQVEVFPQGRSAFRTNTQQAVSDVSRPKLAPGETIYAKFDPNDPQQVAVDHTPIETPATVAVKCPSRGTTQTLAEGQAACSYCRSPLHA